LTCEEDKDGHTDKQGCDQSCSNSTPSGLVGLWRGLDVQKDFRIGEYLMNFSKTSVTWGPLSNPKQFSAKVATTGADLIRLTMANGDVKFARHSDPMWPTGPETHAFAIALQRDNAHEVPPSEMPKALGNLDLDVYVMHKCNDWFGKKCDFSPAFNAPSPTPAVLTASLAGGKDADACTVHADCTSCINDARKVCGFCDGIITFGDGSTCGGDGKGCCGGASGFSKCNVAYRKVCPVMCDRTNWLSPQCREANPKELKDPGTLKFNECKDMETFCKAGRYCDRSNATNPQCKDIKSEDECKHTPGCDIHNPTCGAECTPPKPTPPPTPPPQQYYTCDKTSFQCKQHTGKPVPPSFNTSKECEDNCIDHSIAGVWRALRIENGFVLDEWDFKFSEVTAGATVDIASKKQAKHYKGTYAVGKSLGEVESQPAFELTVKMSTGEVLTGIFSNKDTGPLTKFLYVALPLKDGDKVSDYDAAMDAGHQEFVMISCLPGIDGCDFSPASPSFAGPMSIVI
jgi:hypothetical protein